MVLMFFFSKHLSMSFCTTSQSAGWNEVKSSFQTILLGYRWYLRINSLKKPKEQFGRLEEAGRAKVPLGEDDEMETFGLITGDVDWIAHLS